MLARTVRLAISRQTNLLLAVLQDRNGAERCATWRAPRPAPFLHRALGAQMSPELCSLLDEPRGSDHVVERQIFGRALPLFARFVPVMQVMQEMMWIVGGDCFGFLI